MGELVTEILNNDVPFVKPLISQVVAYEEELSIQFFFEIDLLVGYGGKKRKKETVGENETNINQFIIYKESETTLFILISSSRPLVVPQTTTRNPVRGAMSPKVTRTRCPLSGWKWKNASKEKEKKKEGFELCLCAKSVTVKKKICTEIITSPINLTNSALPTFFFV
eukprot:TRINITY_DN1814_c4_g1_i1.p1 TRINITY_DN1814_c4_g1~~TRINITY_DN1814_c4_g1_i1.p1  ORF type:complete len:167 (-),score=14.53 TRINITY_DN1814_c4_g1_i1:53-553(-)